MPRRSSSSSTGSSRSRPGCRASSSPSRYVCRRPENPPAAKCRDVHPAGTGPVRVDRERADGVGRRSGRPRSGQLVAGRTSELREKLLERGERARVELVADPGKLARRRSGTRARGRADRRGRASPPRRERERAARRSPGRAGAPRRRRRSRRFARRLSAPRPPPRRGRIVGLFELSRRGGRGRRDAAGRPSRSGRPGRRARPRARRAAPLVARRQPVERQRSGGERSAQDVGREALRRSSAERPGPPARAGVNGAATPPANVQGTSCSRESSQASAG